MRWTRTNKAELARLLKEADGWARLLADDLRDACAQSQYPDFVAQQFRLSHCADRVREALNALDENQ